MAASRLQSVNDLDSQKFIQIADIESYLTCNICMQTFDGTAITSCGHRFCLHCITTCLERTPSCPNCKQYIQPNRIVNDLQTDNLIADIREKSADFPDPQTDLPDQNPVPSDPVDINVSDNCRVFFEHLNTKDQRLNEVTERLIAIKTEEVTRHKEKVDRLAIEFNNKSTALLTANGERKKLEDELRKTTSDLNQRAMALNDANKELQRLNKTHHDEIETLKTELQETTTNFEELQKTNIALTQENDYNKNNLETLKQEYWTAVTDLNNQLEILENTNQLFDVENTNANGEIRRLQEALEKSDTNLEKMSGSYIALQTENLSIKNEKQQLYQQVNDRFAQYMEELKQQVQHSVNEIRTSLELEYEQRIKAANEAHKMSLFEKDRQTEILKKQIQDQSDTADDLQQATRSYKSIIREVSDLKDKLHRMKKEKEYFQAQLLMPRSQ